MAASVLAAEFASAIAFRWSLANKLPRSLRVKVHLNGLFVALLKVQEPLLELGQGREVIRGERLSLHDGEVNLDLVEPTGVNRCVHQDDVSPLRVKALDSFLAAMRRAVVHDPEDTVCRLVGLLTHDLSDQAVGGGDAALDLAATEQLGAMHIPSGQIGPCALAKILMFDPHGALRCRRESGFSLWSGVHDSVFVGAAHT